MLKQQLAQKQTALDQAFTKLQALEKELDSLEKAESAVASKLADLTADVVEAQNNIEQAENDLNALRLQLEDRLVSIYKDGGSWSMQYLEALVVEDSLVSVLERFDMLTKLANEDEHLFSEVEEYLEQSRVEKALLEEKVAEQETQQQQLEAAIRQSSAKRAQFATQYQSLQSQAASLRAQIKQAEAQEAAAAAAAAARLKQVSDAAKQSSDKVGTTPTTTKPTTPTTTPTVPGTAGTWKPKKAPTSAAEIAAQARFIDKTYLIPRKSLITGQMVMSVWIKYNITPAESLAVLGAESSMGSTMWGGRLVTEGNNFGCLSYSTSPKWLSWPPPISHGKILVAGRNWMTFPTAAEGMEAWGRYITYGRGKDCYRPLLRTFNWTAFADIYYGANVPGKAKYMERLSWYYWMLRRTSEAAGYTW